MSLLTKLFGKEKKRDLPQEKIDLSQQIFLGKKFKQENYDREIDEGMSSDLVRYVTLDITNLAEGEAIQLINGLEKRAQNFGMCKIVQVGGFNKKGRRYLIVSGESHMYVVGPTRDMMLDNVKELTDKLPVEYINDHITPPVQEESYETINLGPYGSTGNPGLGIKQNPRAKRLREQGRIR